MDGDSGLTNFLFGNVDEDGRLESDVFDDSEKSQVNALSQMGMGGLLDDFDKEAREYMLPEDYKMPPPSPLARDYSHISDDDELEDFDSPGSSKSVQKSNSMPPPPAFKDRKESDGGIILPSLILPSVVNSSDVENEANNPSDKEKEPSTSESQTSEKGDSSRKALRKKKHKEYTEADRVFKQVKKEIRGKIEQASVRELFPNYVKRRPPRFLDLFKHAPNNMDVPNPYRFLQNKKPPQELDFLGDIKEQKEKATTFAKPRSPKLEEIADDDEKIALQEMAWCDEAEIAEEGQKEEKLKKTPQWRNGPAKLWFDMLNVPADGEGFHYGFKLKPEVQKEFDEMDDKEREKRIADDNKVTYDYNLWENLDTSVPLHAQIDWESDIIWDPEDAHKKRSTGSRVDKERLAGWIPKEKSREQDQLQVVGNNSIFPIDNYELIYGEWEREIIWDSQNMNYLPVPKDFKVNPNDDQLILQIPEDPEPRAEFKVKEGGKNKRELFKRTKEVLRDVGIGQKNDDVDDEIVPQLRPEKDIWNLSNDDFYDPKAKADKSGKGGHGVLQHSTPGIELYQSLFPTHLDHQTLRRFHRPHFNTFDIPTGLPLKIRSCIKQNILREKERDRERRATGGGDVFFMRKLSDLSAQDGDIVLTEYCEEFPPLFNMVGMASRIKIWRRRTCRDKPMNRIYKYGEPAYYTHPPFLGQVNADSSQSAFENDMFRCPLFYHNTSKTDFLLIRNEDTWCLREVPETFLLGQQCPLIDVPGPNSKKATSFSRDFLLVFLYRLFLNSTVQPKKIRMEEVRKAFPALSEGSIRKRLKQCAEFKRTGIDSNWWVLASDYRLPTEEEIRAHVKPEEACAFYSMLAAEQRLKDAGYREKSLFLDEKDDEDEASKMDIEILCAPWHTTRAFLAAMKNKCLLDITGAADPTGQAREGFSYVKIPSKPNQRDENTPAQPKKLVTGTDADLRRLNLKQAKDMCRKWGVSDAVMNKLTRWEVIDMVRTLSTRQARVGDTSVSKFARGNRFSAAEHHERYKEECQQRFDLQAKQLGDDRVLTTDDSSSEDDADEIDLMEKNLDALFSSKSKTQREVQEEREEKERKELLKMMSQDSSKKEEKDHPQKNPLANIDITGKVLVIRRKVKNSYGEIVEKKETVRKPEVIEAYLKIRASKTDQEALRKYVQENSDEEKEKLDKLRRERRRLQEQIRRSKKNKRRIIEQSYGGDLDESEEDDGGYPVVRDNKLTISKSLLKGSTKRKRSSSDENPPPFYAAMNEGILIPKKGSGRRGRPTKRTRPSESDYLNQRPMQKRERIRADPQVSISSLFESIILDMKDVLADRMDAFVPPVDKKHVPDYYDIIHSPMCIQMIREKLRDNKYSTREEFLEDFELIYDNAKLYNGVESIITRNADAVRGYIKKRMLSEEDKLQKLERQINPLLDDNDQNQLTFTLRKIIDKFLQIENAQQYFQNPVDKKRYPDYYTKIIHPIDFGTIQKNCQRHYYRGHQHFLEDVELLHANSIKYNGPEHVVTLTAKRVVDLANSECEAVKDHLDRMESGILQSQENHREFMDDLELSDNELEDSEEEEQEETQLQDLQTNEIGQVQVGLPEIIPQEQQILQMPQVLQEEDSTDFTSQFLSADLDISDESSDDPSANPNLAFEGTGLSDLSGDND